MWVLTGKASCRCAAQIQESGLPPFLQRPLLRRHLVICRAHYAEADVEHLLVGLIAEPVRTGRPMGAIAPRSAADHLGVAGGRIVAAVGSVVGIGAIAR